MLMRIPSLILSAAFIFTASHSFADNVRIAFIDPLSGPFAPVGQNLLHSFQTIAELSNQKQWGGQHTVEIVGFDNKEVRKNR